MPDFFADLFAILATRDFGRRPPEGLSAQDLALWIRGYQEGQEDRAWLISALVLSILETKDDH